MKTAEQIKTHIATLLDVARKSRDIKFVKRTLKETAFLKKCLPVAEEFNEAHLKKQLFQIKILEQRIEAQLYEAKRQDPTMTKKQILAFKREFMPNRTTQKKVITFLLKPYEEEDIRLANN